MPAADASAIHPPLRGLLYVAFVTGLITFLAYAATAARTITWWDGSSYPLAARTLGVNSPPGSLLLVLLGWLASSVPVVRPVAFQLHLFAALVSAVTAGVVAVLAIRLVTPEGQNPGRTERIAGGIAGFVFAFCATPWTYATQFTPYGLSACFTALILAAAFAWWRRAATSDDARGLFVLFLLFGLDFSVHRTNAVLIPGAFAWIALRRPRVLRRPADLAAIGVGMVAGLAFQLLLIPLSRRNPVFDMGGPRDLTELWSYFSLAQSGGAFLIDLFPRRANVWSVQLADYGRFLERNLAPGAWWTLGPALLAALGIGIALRKTPRRALALLAFVFSAGFGAVIYFNRP